MNLIYVESSKLRDAVALSDSCSLHFSWGKKKGLFFSSVTFYLYFSQGEINCPAAVFCFLQELAFISVPSLVESVLCILDGSRQKELQKKMCMHETNSIFCIWEDSLSVAACGLVCVFVSRM